MTLVCALIVMFLGGHGWVARIPDFHKSTSRGNPGSQKKSSSHFRSRNSYFPGGRLWERLANFVWRSHFLVIDLRDPPLGFCQTCLQTCREVISQINQVIQNKKGNFLRNNMTLSVETEIDVFKKFLIAILSKLNLKSVFSLRFSVISGLNT